MTMRLIQNMITIAECPTPECPSNRVIKIAVIGGSGVGKTGKTIIQFPMLSPWFITQMIPMQIEKKCIACSNIHLFFLLTALVVRFLTKRFIGDYERNAGKTTDLNEITSISGKVYLFFLLIFGCAQRVFIFVVLTVCLRSFSAGNLYSREVQVDGEQVAVQVQDTPGVEVRSSRTQIDHNPLITIPTGRFIGRL